jgi:hypothetical protein
MEAMTLDVEKSGTPKVSQEGQENVLLITLPGIKYGLDTDDYQQNDSESQVRCLGVRVPERFPE